MTKGLIELLKDRDYFYRKAKKEKDDDYWNIAKFLRNIANSSIRQAKREFILGELRKYGHDAKKFWKVIREVIPSWKQTKKKDIRLKNNNVEIEREKTAQFINDYFINIGNVGQPNVSSPEVELLNDGMAGINGVGACKLNNVREYDVHLVNKYCQVLRS